MVKNCCVCEKDDAPYKCPICRKPYCSVVCCKEHKAQPCEPICELPEKPDERQSEVIYAAEFPTQDTVPPEKMCQLRHSEELRACLGNPNVREIMKGVLRSKNPTDAIALAMKEPLFVEMADACLKIVESREPDGVE